MRFEECVMLRHVCPRDQLKTLLFDRSLALQLKGSDPGTLNGFDARPVYQYVHPAKRELRPSSGAYEYVP